LVFRKRNWIPHPFDQFGVCDKENIFVVVEGVLNPIFQKLTVVIFIQPWRMKVDAKWSAIIIVSALKVLL
jgi:hypothetical protein